METVAIIPARGGSKGIQKKNITPILGAPLIAHTLVQARASNAIEATFVSTDAEDIAAVSRSYGAEVIDRPADLAGDEASTESALLHALGELRRRSIDPATVVLLQCTSPLRRPSDIGEAVRLVRDDEYESALSCCVNHDFLWRETDGGAEPVNYNPKHRSRRQDLQQYRENGSIYVMETEILDTQECRLGGAIGIHLMPETLSFEIDEPPDLDIVEAMANTTEHELLLANPTAE